MSLHVLQLGPYPPPEGGVSRNMLAIRDELLARGHRCTIIATTRSSRIDGEPNVHHPRSAFALLRLLSSLKFDVLHLHLGGNVTERVLTLTASCSFFGRNKNILTLHSGAYPLTEKARTASPSSISGRIFRRFSRVIAVNEAIADVFRRYGVSADRIKVILPYSLRRPDEKVTVPKGYSDFYGRHSPMVVSVGGLERDYDPVLQIDAMRDVLAEFPNAGLMIVGDGSMRAQVENAVANCGYSENIFLAGNVEHDVTLHLINDADILLRATHFDGDAISIREALFLGTPVIATDTRARPDGVHLIGIGDKGGLVAKIGEIVNGATPERTVKEANTDNIAAVIEIYRAIAGRDETERRS